jgi:hypothetical protein
MRGGVKETEAKEFAVIPWMRSGERAAVITVTPVAK